MDEKKQEDLTQEGRKPGDTPEPSDPMEDHGGGSDPDGSDATGLGPSGGGPTPTPEH